jgi:cyclophilin family peptidyl-prolyl cis-trans isomerase
VRAGGIGVHQEKSRMRWLESRRQQKMKNRVTRATGLAVEALESRTLLNATLSTPINGVSTSTTIDLSQHFNDPLVPGTLVDVVTPKGAIPIALTDTKTPKTVANFLSYINNGEYQGTIFHRLATGFALQGGGYDTAGTHITQQAAIQSESGASNVTGSVAMALSSGPNSGTSEWFVNLANNNGSGSTPNLDNTSDGGPFTVFGNVVYNGMSVVNQIAALPTIDGTSLNAAFSNTLPVLNSSAGTTASNLVTTNYQVVPALTYQASSDDPSIATASVSGTQLSLNVLNPNASTQIHVTATDAGGNTATSTFSVGQGAGVTTVTVTVGTKGVQVVRFNDAGGTQGNISLSGGKGTATVTLTGTNLVQLPGKNQVVQVRGSVQSTAIAVTGTTPTSVLTVWGKGGNGVVHLSSITNDAHMAMLNAPHCSLSGPLTETGAIDKVVLGSAANGTITIGAGTTAAMNITTMNNVQINSFIAINQLNVDTWTGTGGISATSLNDIKINHSFNGTVSAARVKEFKAGSIVGGNWNVTGAVHLLRTSSVANLSFTAVSLGKLQVDGSVSTTTVHTSSNIDNIKAGAFTSTNVYAGADALNTGIPASTTDFTAQSLIKSISVNRFVNSNIGAQRADNLSLGTVQTSNNGIVFGVGTQHIKKLSLAVGGKRVELQNVTSTAQVTNAFSKQKINPQDLQVNIVA